PQRVVRGSVAEPEVVSDRSRGDEGPLRDEMGGARESACGAGARGVRARGDGARGDGARGDGARLWRPQPREQLEQGRLTRSRDTGEDGKAGPRREADAVHDRLVRAGVG